jgi:hypothetical protein
VKYLNLQKDSSLNFCINVTNTFSSLETLIIGTWNVVNKIYMNMVNICAGRKAYVYMNFHFNCIAYRKPSATWVNPLTY